MSDARWLDIESDIASAIRHFGLAVEIHETDDFEDEGLVGYRARMALMHSLQSGHTSAETAFLKFLAVLGEDPPVGPDWHETLLWRPATERHDEFAHPAVIDARTRRELDEMRRFRHRAMHVYEEFNHELSRPAVEAARTLPDLLRETLRKIQAWD